VLTAQVDIIVKEWEIQSQQTSVMLDITVLLDRKLKIQMDSNVFRVTSVQEAPKFLSDASLDFTRKTQIRHPVRCAQRDFTVTTAWPLLFSTKTVLVLQGIIVVIKLLLHMSFHVHWGHSAMHLVSLI